MELRDKSMYDIVEENLQKKKRKMYVHRLIYIFNYGVEDVKEIVLDEEDIIEKFGELVEAANYPDNRVSISSHYSGEPQRETAEGETDQEEKVEGHTEASFDKKIQEMMLPENIYYHDEQLSGVLFMYDEPIGIHLLEGSDAMLMKHIESLFRREVSWTENLKSVKMLGTFHHIFRRIVTRWTQLDVISQPPFQPIESPVTDEDHCELFEQCLVMIAKVNDFLIHGDSSYFMKERYINYADPDVLSGKLNKLMPPVQLLKHLLNSPILEDLQMYSYRLAVIPKPIPYHEMVWPLPTSHVPHYHDIFMRKGESFYEYTMRMKEERH